MELSTVVTREAELALRWRTVRYWAIAQHYWETMGGLA